MTGDDVEGIVQLKHDLHTIVTIEDLGLVRYFLGIEISISPKWTLLNQRKYLLDILTNASLTRAKPAKFPLTKGLKLSTDLDNILPNLESYRRVIGRLLYLTLTRSYIFYVVQHLSQFLQESRDTNYQATMHVLMYLKGTPN